MTDAQSLVKSFFQARDKQASPRTPEPPFKPEAIYFDTNPLLGAGWPTPSAQLLEVMSQAEKLGFPLCLPEVVNQELEGHWIREVVEERGRANDQIASLNKKARSVVNFTRLPALPANHELRADLRNLVSDFNQRFRIVPTTTRPLAEFVSLAINRGATFKDEGRGFQDAVILCSAVDDMTANGFAAAILVTRDDAFRSSGASELVRASGVTLKIISTLDELEGLLREHFNSTVRDFLDWDRGRLMEALNQRLPDLERYLVENLTVAPSDLRVGGTVRKIESLQVVSIENVHSGNFRLQGQPTDPTHIRVSAEVKIRLSLDIERYSLPASPPALARLKVGGTAIPASDPALNPFPIFLEADTKSQEAVALVEAEAIESDTGYSVLRFTSAYLKPGDWSFGILGKLFGGSK